MNRIGWTAGMLLAVLLAACSGATVKPSGGVATEAPASAPSVAAAPATQAPSLPAESAPGEAAPGEAAPGEAPIGPTERARVVRIVDGDTIVIDRGHGQEKLRYIGMDTPESVKPGTPVQFMAREASAANAALVGGREVWLERDVSEVDRYGRLLRYVWLKDPTASGWLLVNLVLVAQGYAQVATYPPDVRYVDLFTTAQRGAREQGLGLWSEDRANDTSAPPAGSTGGARAGCDPAYPGVCIPPPPPDLDCADITFHRFEVLPPDPHHFDGDGNGIGCERG